MKNFGKSAHNNGNQRDLSKLPAQNDLTADQCVGTACGVEIPLVPISRKAGNVTEQSHASERVRPEKKTANVATNTYDIESDGKMTSRGDKQDEAVVMLKNNRVTEWLLRCSIGDVQLGAVIDSGAVMSTMNYKTFQSLGTRVTLTPTDQRIRGVGGHSVHVHGVVKTMLGIADREYAVKFVILDSPENVLLGADFLSDYNVQVDFGNATARIGRTEIVLRRDTEQNTLSFTLPHDVKIPPNSEMAVRLTGKSNQTNDVAKNLPIILEPTSNVTDSGVMLGRCLTTSVKPVALLLNHTDEAIHIKACKRFVTGSGILEVRDSNDTYVKQVSAEERVDDITFDMLPKELQSLVPTSLPKEKCSLIIRMLYEFRDIFALPGNEMGRTDAVKHEINVDIGVAPVRLPKRRLPLKQQDIVTTEITKMLEKGIIQESQSPWTSPVVIVKKKDGTYRFCVDYRKLNDVTWKDSYPLPNIEDTFNTLAGARYFCSLDLAAGYWQVAMDEKSMEKTAFATREGLFEFTVMPFGLCNAPATFERLMDKVLGGLLWDRCMCYLDDIIVFGETFFKTLANLELVLQRVRSSGLRLKPSKCMLFKEELLYLGFVITRDGVRSDPAKVEVVKDWPIPCNITDVRSFLGFCNYHRKFIANYAEIAEPLIALTRGRVNFQWLEKQQIAFNELRNCLIDGPMLPHPDPNPLCDLILDTDASLTGLGGVLSQVVDGKERVLAYASKTLTTSQRSYCATYRELLAVVEMTKHFRHYLWGRQFTLRTDHASLVWLKNYKDADGMLARWLAKLEEYNFITVHRAGKAHGNADGLSRCHSCNNPRCIGKLPPLVSSDSEPIPALRPARRRATSDSSTSLADTNTDSPDVTSDAENELPSKDKLNTFLNGHTSLDIATAQAADPTTGLVISWLLDKYVPPKDEMLIYDSEIRSLMARRSSLSIVDDKLYREIEIPGRGKINVLVLPKNLRNDVLHQLHDLQIVGHMGIRRTLLRVKQRFYWPNMALDVNRWCAKCPKCCSRKGKPTPTRVPMTTFPTGAPFDRIAMDILDTHKVTSRRNRYVLVISDYFTKYTDAIPLRRHTAKNVANALMSNWIAYHGVPSEILSDQGREFEGELFRRLSRLLQFKKIRTSPYHPQTDGQVERFNRTLLGMLSAFVSDSGKNWDLYLPYVLMAYRSSVHASTGCTPNMMVYGRESTLPVDLVYDIVPREVPSCPQDYVELVKEALITSHSFARSQLKKAALRQKRGYDARARDRPPFNVGDLVRYYYPPLRQQNKFARPWTGPWEVLRQTSSVDYEISLVSNPEKRRIVHFDTLKLFEGYKTDTSDITSSSMSDNESDSSDIYGCSPTRPNDQLADVADLFLPHPSELTANECNSSDSDERGSASSPDDTRASDRKERRRGLRPRHTLRPPKRYSN